MIAAACQVRNICPHRDRLDSPSLLKRHPRFSAFSDFPVALADIHCMAANHVIAAKVRKLRTILALLDRCGAGMSNQWRNGVQYDLDTAIRDLGDATDVAKQVSDLKRSGEPRRRD